MYLSLKGSTIYLVFDDAVAMRQLYTLDLV